MELIGIFFIASGLLVFAGVAKALRPDDTARALATLLPNAISRILSFDLARQVVRIVAVTEAALGVCALLFPGIVTAAMVAVSYMLFVCIVVHARSRGGALSTCGCFGRPDTPATGLHVVLNVAFVVTAVAVALQPPHFTASYSFLENQPWDGVPLLLASGVGMCLSYLALSSLPALEGVRRSVSNHAGGR
jgi:hypothetical protein